MYLYQSNRLEDLFSLLCKTLARPLGDPLTSEIIVVQNPGMARWLSHHIAQTSGIAANLEFPLPASFIWSIFESTLGELPDLSNFTREVLLWRILAELGDLSSKPDMAEIIEYLQDDADGLRSFQLANKISDLFDQYLIFRPDILLDWEKSAQVNDHKHPLAGRMENHWQADIWRTLTTHHSLHRASLLKKFLEHASRDNLRIENLPERVSIFGINTLAPAYLAVIDKISKYADIHIFHLSPCRQAWDDILPERLLSIKRKSWRESGVAYVEDYFTSGNPLLASMGMVGREFFSLLQQYNIQEKECYETPQQNSLLGAIQTDILDLLDRTKTPGQEFNAADTSIAFHDCHSPMREIQVLHDRLLDLFAADPDLKPADILVMAPDINRYTPCITGVFGAAADKMFIPWSVADRNHGEEDMVISCFLGMLALATSRCSVTEIMALLENPVIRTKFQINEDDITCLRLRVTESGIRWGLNQHQRQQQGLDDSNLHTWEHGLQRLLLGYITGPMDTCWQEIMPSATKTGNMGPWLGGLAGFLRRLQSLQTALSNNHTPDHWSVILLQMIDDFFAAELDEYADAIRLLRETVHDFATNTRQASCLTPLSITVIRNYFNEQLAMPSAGHPFLAGKVTFCNMVPMRSLPFKIIWLLGMNDTDFPRSRRPPDFDLMAKKPRLGDRNLRDDDRYLFLEALLSARHHLIISWVGRDQRENNVLPPSVVVAELHDYLDRGWPTDPVPASELLTTRHPLQPFSRHCFNDNPKTAGYTDLWLPVAVNQQDNLFFNSPLPDLGMQQIELGMLVKFWNHPVRFFLEQRLGLRPDTDDELLPDSEPFALDPLTGYQIGVTMLTRLLAGRDPLTVCRKAQASALLPHGEIGQIHCRQKLAASTTILNTLHEHSRVPTTTIEIALPIAGITLIGQLNALYPCGRISLRPAKWKPKDLLQLWIHHLVLGLTHPGNIRPVSRHISTDAVLTLSPVENPRAGMESIIKYFLQGMIEPLHFYPDTSYALASAKNEATGMNKARSRWYSGYQRGEEEEDPAYSVALRGQEPLDEQFRVLAKIFHPILELMEEEDAAV